MKRLPNSLLIPLFAFLFVTHSWAQTGDIVEIKTDPSIHYQAMDGFGASDAWRAQLVGKNWPLEKRDEIADLLFSREFDRAGNPLGIGLSLWRFNITASTAEQGDNSGIKNIWRRGECFQSPENGLLVSAYKDLKNGRLVHVLTNLSEQAILVNMGGSDDVKSYTTDKNSDMEYSTQKSNRIEVPERSVVTIVR